MDLETQFVLRFLESLSYSVCVSLLRSEIKISKGSVAEIDGPYFIRIVFNSVFLAFLQGFDE